MNTEKLNEIMNCNCLQEVIKNDDKKFTREESQHEKSITYKLHSPSIIVFETCTNYRKTVTDIKSGRVEVDRRDTDTCGIPFLYCPICGQKTKNIAPEDSWYNQFQK
jgi:hypothetical protein